MNNTKIKNTELWPTLKRMTSQQSPIDDDIYAFGGDSAEEIIRMKQEFEDLLEGDRDRPHHAGWVLVNLSDTRSYLYRPSGHENLRPNPSPFALRRARRRVSAKDDAPYVSGVATLPSAALSVTRPTPASTVPGGASWSTKRTRTGRQDIGKPHRLTPGLPRAKQETVAAKPGPRAYSEPKMWRRDAKSV